MIYFTIFKNNNFKMKVTTLYKLPKDLLVKLISHIQEDTEERCKNDTKTIIKDIIKENKFEDYLEICDNENCKRLILLEGCCKNYGNGCYLCHKIFCDICTDKIATECLDCCWALCKCCLLNNKWWPPCECGWAYRSS